MSRGGLSSEDGRYWRVLAFDLVAVTLFLVLGFAAPRGGWWFLLAALWAVVGIWRGATEARKRAPEETGSYDEEWEARAFAAAPAPGGREAGCAKRGAKVFALAGAGSLAVLGALLVTPFEPVFAAFGPVRIVVYFGLVVLAATTGVLSVTLSAARVTDARHPAIGAAMRFCAAMGCALLAGLALLTGDSLLGRPEGVLSGLAVPAAAGLLLLRRAPHPLD
ncbi:hypothetical protein [Sinomonas humi]|uniref:Uncharacterized protein n=1 Tax=Sinomonas humi TaxID=1338436 RepID=A0A0B2AS42_9MICC|nr:hypothetical protein [Sinomonas humi]KHL04675.1 hypothetical protein LK10_04330 [Sinomonas humi]